MKSSVLDGRPWIHDSPKSTRFYGDYYEEDDRPRSTNREVVVRIHVVVKRAMLEGKGTPPGFLSLSRILFRD